MKHTLADLRKGRLGKPKPRRRKIKKSPRKLLELSLELKVKEIIFWRDGSECVEKNLDGSKCRAGVQWGHVIPQGKSPMLVHSLSNVFAQCPNHNFLHHKKDPMYHNWYVQRWGQTAFDALCQFMRDNTGKKYTLAEMEKIMQSYKSLYENRFYVEHTDEWLVAGGYFGEIIKEAWKKDGRI